MTKPAASAVLETPDHRRYDRAFPEWERLPTLLSLTFAEAGGAVQLIADDRRLGDGLTDARRIGDDYRFHDALHLALGVRLGWSPVLRAMLGRKRRSDPVVDECEDGGRACMVEEAVCHIIHVHRGELTTADGSPDLVALIVRMTRGFEVEASSARDWAAAVSLGLSTLSRLVNAGGGTLQADFVRGKIRHLRNSAAFAPGTAQVRLPRKLTSGSAATAAGVRVSAKRLG